MSVHADLRGTKSAFTKQVESPSTPSITSLHEYETWDRCVPLLRITRLYYLDPIGLGTPMVESLTGYIARLAEAHCVSVGVLYQKEIRMLADQGNIFTFRIPIISGYSINAINGIGSTAADFVRALETLTGRRDLSFLTLLTWAWALSCHSLLRRFRAWCESCFYAWREANQPIYEPLLWTFQAVTICPYHRRPLRQVCPHCGQHIAPLKSRSRCDCCSRCQQTLVPATISPTSDSRMLTDDELMWAMWVARVLGDLLAAAPQITCRQERGHLAEIFRLCIDSVSSRNVSVFARLMHVDPETARNWQNGKRIPQLPFLLSMAYRLGISLLDLLLESPALVSPKFVRAAPVEVEVRTKRPTMQHGRRISRAEVSGILNTALNEIPPPSVKQVMGRLIYGEATIYRHFPELRRQIAQRYAEYRRKRAIARKAQAAEEVKRAAYKLHATGISLTYRHIRPFIDQFCLP